MIYLSPECKSGLGEDTFWTWFEREFNNSRFQTPGVIGERDIILRYSTLGAVNVKGRQVGLLWELHPEMCKQLGYPENMPQMARIADCAAKSESIVTASKIMVPFYEKYGNIDVIPIGVNTDMFMPYNQKEMRAKHGIDPTARVGVWCGTTHHMKGYNLLLEFAKNNPDIHWIVIWKQKHEASHFEGHKNFTLIPQQQIAELMSAGDFFLSTSLLRPYFMIEWEAMACDIPFEFAPGAIQAKEKDFVPSDSPREDLFRLGWSRTQTKETWSDYLSALGVDF